MHELADQIAAQRPLLLRIARRRVRNPTWAEDAVSEALIAALENPRAFNGRSSMRSWLTGILNHKLVDQIRRHTRECQFEAHDDENEHAELTEAEGAAAWDRPADSGDPQERLSRRQFMALLDECLKELPAQQGRAFMLRNWLEEDTSDICAQLGITANNLAVTLHRARTRLRASLQRHWPSGSGATRPSGRIEAQA